jgi:hypothetical protein
MSREMNDEQKAAIEKINAKKRKRLKNKKLKTKAKKAEKA